MPLSILSFTTVFPRPGAPAFGVFVQSRLLKIAELSKVRVISPVAWIEYGNPAGRIPRNVPSGRSVGMLEVRYPRWFYLPGLAFLTPFFLAACALPRVLSERFDVLDSHFGHPDGIAAAFLAWVCRRPFTVTLRGNETMHAKHPAIRRMMGWALRRAARVITVSSRLGEFAVSLGVDPGRVVTIPNGIDPEIFYPRDRQACRENLGMREAAQHIVSVGYLIPRKGHHHVIEAVASMRSSGVDVELWILGNPGAEGAFADRLHELALRLKVADAVHFVPAVKQAELAGYMTAGDLLCLASNREGWPNVVHEALACGCPVVASDVGGVPDMLPSRKYGLVVPIEPSADFQTNLESALLQAIRSQWDRDSIAAWGHRRTWSMVAGETLAQLEIAAHPRSMEEAKLSCGS